MGEVEQKQKTAVDLIELYAEDFGLALPRHIDAGQWIKQSVAAIRKSKDLVRAANNDPGAAMRVLMEAARLGHVPGTEQYYLIPRGDKELGYEDYVNGRGEQKRRKRQRITGIEGYRGIVQRMYRAGAVQSVIVELVYANDTFEYRPGDRPIHDAGDWFGDDRGDVKGVYAYAVMLNGAISKVALLSTRKVNDEHRALSESWKNAWSRENSPWTTNWDDMALKTATRQLERWVPTSSEYREQQLRLAEIARQNVEIQPAPEEPVVDAETVEGEIVEEGADEPDAQ